LQNLKGFAHWLGFSLYFLTLYDIAFGTLTTLNSIYILYKICSKYPDNRPPGQTRLRVALTRLFGRKKEVVKKTQANEEMPMQFMNMPSPSAPEMPQVRMISTPKPVRSRTPVRRIQIEEYPGSSSSSSDEIMPLRSAMKQPQHVRINTIPTVKTIKRRAPPTPIVAELYLRDHMPLYMMDSE
jgi:hypothetical protein